jgi:hypothetical protein
MIDLLQIPNIKLEFRAKTSLVIGMSQFYSLRALKRWIEDRYEHQYRKRIKIDRLSYLHSYTTVRDDYVDWLKKYEWHVVSTDADLEDMYADLNGEKLPYRLSITLK